MGKDNKPRYVKSAVEYFGFDRLIGSERNDVRLRFRELLEKEVAPIANKFYEKGEYPHDLCKLMATSGMNKYACGKPYGYGVDALTYGLIAMESSRIDASFATMYLVHTALFAHTLEEFGSEELKAEYMPGIMDSTYIGAWGLNGSKRWPGNANKELMTVFARNTTTKEINCFLVHLDWPGITRDRIENKMSLRAVHNMNIHFNNVKVAHKYRLTKVNKFSDINEML